MNINISEAEWEVMRVIWSNDNVTSKKVIEALQEKKTWSISTIKTLLARLVEKNILRTTKSGNKFIYNAVYSEDDCLEVLTKNFLKKFCAKKTKIIAEYVLKENLSKKDIDKLILILKENQKSSPEEVLCNCVKGQCTCGKHH